MYPAAEAYAYALPPFTMTITSTRIKLSTTTAAIQVDAFDEDVANVHVNILADIVTSDAFV